MKILAKGLLFPEILNRTAPIIYTKGGGSKKPGTSLSQNNL